MLSDNRVRIPFDAPLTARLVLLLAFGARAFGLGAQSLWYDEAVSLYLARQNVDAMLAHTAGDIHPPLYYLLLHYWAGWAGSTEFSAAFFSLFFGVLIVAVGFRLARDWFGLPTAGLAAFLLAVSSFQLWYAQEVRMYTLAGTLALASLWFLERVWRSGFDIRGRMFWLAVAGYALSVVLGLYTHYYFVFLWIAEFAYIALLLLIDHVAWRRVGLGVLALVRRVRARGSGAAAGAEAAEATPIAGRIRRAATIVVQHPLTLWGVAQAGVVLLFAPWLATAYRQATDPPVPPWRSAVAPFDALAETVYALSFGQSLAHDYGPDLLVGLALGFAALALLATVQRPRGGDGRGIARRWLLACSVAVPFVLIMLASARAPLFHVRYMFIFDAAFLALVAAGFALIARRSPLVTVLLLGVVFGGMLMAEAARRGAPAYAKDDYRSAVSYIAERVRPGDAVLVNAGYIYPAFVYYYREPIAWRGRLTDYTSGQSGGLVVAQTGSLDASPNLGWGSPESDFYATDEAATLGALERLLRDHPRLWVLRANDTVNDPRGVIRAYLAKNALAVDEITVPGESYVKVQSYVARGAALDAFGAPSPAARQSFGDRVALLGSVAPPAAPSDTPLDVTLFWQPLAPIDIDYHVSVGLFDARNRRVASVDGVPVGRLMPAGDWPQGQVLPDVWRIPVPRGVPPGTYNVLVTLYDPHGGKPLPVPNGVDGIRARAGQVQIIRPVEPAAPGFWPPRPTFGDALALESFGVAPGPIRPGNTVRVDLMWRALKAPGVDLVVGLNLVDDRGRQWAAQELAPAEGRYPASAWAAGEYVADARDLPVPVDAPSGSYRVVMTVYAARSRETLGARNGWWPFPSDSIELGSVNVVARERVMKAPAGMTSAGNVRFGDSAMLAGYDLRPAPSAAGGGKLAVTLVWKALAPARVNYKVFVHVVGANEQIAAQKDGEPGDGTLPMTGWLEGEYLTDRYQIELPPSIAGGSYTVYVGVYDPATTARLPIVDVDGQPAGDRWRLAAFDWP